MKIIISGLMGPGTLEAKIDPLSKVKGIDEIIFIRKKGGHIIPKVKYLTLPTLTRFKVVNVFLTPIILIRQTIKYKPNLIIGYHFLPYAYFTALAGWITKTPYIIAQTGLSIQKNAKHNPLIFASLKIIFKKSFQVNCPGKASQNFWQSIYPQYSHKFKVLHSTINTEVFTPAQNGIQEYDFIFLGRLHRIKNVNLIIKAIKDLKTNSLKNEPSLIIVGDGPESDNLKHLVKKLNLEKQIHFTGFVDNPITFIQKAKFLVMASSTEAMPTAMMQAMACQVIPITNSIGNISDMVENMKSGFIYNKPIISLISKTLEKALSTDDKTIKEMEKRGRNVIIKNHSHQFAISKWSRIISNL